MNFGLFKILLIPVATATMLTIALVLAGQEVPKSGQAGSELRIEQAVYLRKLLYSPGDLGASHKKVDCIGCHNPLQRIDDSGCKRCHTIESLKTAPQGASTDTHRVLLGLSGQPHTKKQVSCISCHLQHDGTRRTVKRSLKQIGHDGFLKEEPSCKDCHQKERARHAGMTNERCDECHTVDNWRTPFSHRQLKELDTYIESSTGNRLVLHAKACGRCHQNGWHLTGADKQQAPGSSSFECLACHRF